MLHKDVWEVEISLDGTRVFERVLVIAETMLDAVELAETHYKQEFKEETPEAISVKKNPLSVLQAGPTTGLGV